MDIKKCNLTMLIDSREQKLFHITDVWDTNNIPYTVLKEKQSMKVGDYSIGIKLPNGEYISLADKVAIERKANLNELCNNFNEGRDENGNSRIVREFIRAKEKGIKLILLVEEEDTYEKALRGQFRDDKPSKMNSNAFIGMLMAYKARYGFELIFLNKQYSASFMYRMLYYEAREYLKSMEV